MSRKPNPAAGIGKDIRDARESLDWSQHKLASEAGVSRSTIARVETGSNISTGASRRTRTGSRVWSERLNRMYLYENDRASARSFSCQDADKEKQA